jgi:hypothetical protein
MSIFHESRLTLAQAAKQLGVHVATVWRWQQRGVKLETYVMGHIRYTSAEALERFAAACTAAADGAIASSSTPAARRRAIAAAERELADAGI